MKPYKFFLVNFPAGAGGKFLSSVLMASKSVAHFDPAIELSKNSDLCLKYIKEHFVSNLSDWTIYEPKQADAWNLHFISSNYPRGDDLSLAEFHKLAQLHGSLHFKNMVEHGKLIIIPWHKPTVPLFFSNSLRVIILVDKESHNWFDTSLWRKHYEIKNNKVYFRMHDQKSNPSMKKYIEEYNNPITTDMSIEEVYLTHIIKNPNKQIFSSIDKFEPSKNLSSLTLSDLLSKDKFINAISNIETKFNLATIDKQFIEDAHQYWRSLHNY